MKIFEPKPPPTSGAMTRNLCSGAMPTKAAMTRRATCGVCVAFHKVRWPLGASYSASAARGSMAVGTSRVLVRSSFVTCLAFLNAGAGAVGDVFGGEHAGDAGHFCSRRGVALLDLGVRVRRANEINRRLPRPVDVVGVVALAGDETLVFLAAH